MTGRRGLAFRLRAWVLVPVLANCSEPAPSSPSAPPSTPAPRLEADLVGPRALVRGAEGVLPLFDIEKTPVVRVRGGGVPPAPRLRLSAEGQPPVEMAVRVDARPELTFLRAAAPESAPPAGLKRLELVGADGQAAATWRVQWGTPPSRLEALQAAARARKEAGDAAARALIDRTLGEAAAEVRPWLLGERARTLQGGDDPGPAVAAWEQAADAALAADLPSEATRAWRAAAYQFLSRRRFRDAMALLDRAEPVDRELRNAEGLARLLHYRAAITGALGDFRRAVELGEASAAQARALALDTEAAGTEQQLAHLFQVQGQHQRALELLRRAEGTPWPRETDRADFENNYGWAQLQAMTHGAIPRNLAAPRALFEAARGRFRAAGDASREAIVVANLAWVAFLSDDLAGARARLAEFRSLEGKTRGYAALFATSLEAELLLAEKKPALAQAAFREAERLAHDESGGLDSDFGWRARYGLGRALAAAGDAEAALKAYREALAALGRVSARTAFQVGRASFFDDRRSLVDDLLALLLQRGAVDEAFTVAEAAQAHVLRAMEARVRVEALSPAQRAEWAQKVETYLALRQQYEASNADAELLGKAALARWEAERKHAREALSRAFDAAYGYLDQAAPALVGEAAEARRVAAALQPDEALVTFVSIGDRLHSFFVQGGRIRSAPVPGDDLLASWPLDGVQHLYVVPSGAPRALDLAARPSPDGRALLAHRNLSFVPHAGFLVDREGAAPTGTPVVVADPSENLPNARAEGAFVASLLPGARLLSGSAADRDVVLKALAQAPLFHFAGHGVLHPDSPWEAHLQLAAEHRLTLADLFAAHPRVGTVVLSGCETGLRLNLGRHESVGLPEAFLSAGARTVIATRRVVADEKARAFVERFYREGGAATPGKAWRAAVLATAAAGDESWRDFQLYGRP